MTDSERYLNMARGWFSGWTGNIALADGLFSETVRTNGVLAGVAGPEHRIQERLQGFPDEATCIEDMFSAGDNRDFAVRRFEDDNAAEISTIQDQFPLLRRIGYLREDVYAA